MPALLRALRTSLPAQPLTALGLLQYLSGGGRSASGIDVSPETAMRHMAVMRAISLTAGTIASLDLKTYRDVPDPETGAPVRQETTNQLFLDPMHAELDITWFEGIEFIVSTVMRHGNSCSLMIRNEGGDRIVRLLPLPAEVVERIWRGRDLGGGPQKLFKIAGIDEILTATDVLHIPGLSLDGISGMSPIDAAREAIGIGLAAEQVAAHLYDSGLLNGGFLKANGPLTPTQSTEAKQRWREKVGGLIHAYEVAIVSEGFDYIPAQMPPKDAQFLESRQFSVAEIGRLYGVPPALLFDYTATGNVEAEKLGAQWLRFSLNQFLARLEDRLSWHLLPRGQYCGFITDGLWRGTVLEQAQAEALEIASGTLTADEARAAKGRAPLPEPVQAPAAPAPAIPADELPVPEEVGADER